MDGMRVVLIAMAFALVVVACGGDSVTVEADTPGPVAVDNTGPREASFDAGAAALVRSTAASALAQFGDLETAGTAILVAYDAGFSFDQIAAGVASGGLSAAGQIDGVEPELALDPVGAPRAVPAGFRELDVDELRRVLAEERAKLASRTLDDDSISIYTELIVWAVRDGFPPDVIIEAIVLGDLTEATVDAIEERNREIRREEVIDELDYCRMRSSMAAVTGLSLSYEQCVLDQTGSTLDDLYGPAEQPDSSDDTVDEADDGEEDEPASDSGGLRDYSLIPGPDGTMTSESISLTVDGSTAVLAVSLVFRTAVDYVDEAPVCWEDFTFTSGGSDLNVDGAQVSGSVELILDFDGATLCPESEQDDIGVPQLTGVSGEIDGSSFVGDFSFDGFSLPFVAVVS